MVLGSQNQLVALVVVVVNFASIDHKKFTLKWQKDFDLRIEFEASGQLQSANWNFLLKMNKKFLKSIETKRTK